MALEVGDPWDIVVQTQTGARVKITDLNIIPLEKNTESLTTCSHYERRLADFLRKLEYLDGDDWVLISFYDNDIGGEGEESDSDEEIYPETVWLRVSDLKIALQKPILSKRDDSIRISIADPHEPLHSRLIIVEDLQNQDEVKEEEEEEEKQSPLDAKLDREKSWLKYLEERLGNEGMPLLELMEIIFGDGYSCNGMIDEEYCSVRKDGVHVFLDIPRQQLEVYLDIKPEEVWRNDDAKFYPSVPLYEIKPGIDIRDLQALAENSEISPLKRVLRGGGKKVPMLKAPEAGGYAEIDDSTVEKIVIGKRINLSNISEVASEFAERRYYMSY